MSVTQRFTVKPVLRVNKKSVKTGLVPVYYRLTVDRKTSYRSTNFKVLESCWDEATSEVINLPNAKLINAKLRHDCNEIEREILGQHIKGHAVTRRILKAKPSATPFSKYAKEIKGDTRATRKEITRVENFHGGDP